VQRHAQRPVTYDEGRNSLDLGTDNGSGLDDACDLITCHRRRIQKIMRSAEVHIVDVCIEDNDPAVQVALIELNKAQLFGFNLIEVGIRRYFYKLDRDDVRLSGSSLQ